MTDWAEMTGLECLLIMFFGADYYPEHWPEERWTLDAKMMREVIL